MNTNIYQQAVILGPEHGVRYEHYIETDELNKLPDNIKSLPEVELFIKATINLIESNKLVSPFKQRYGHTLSEVFEEMYNMKVKQFNEIMENIIK